MSFAARVISRSNILILVAILLLPLSFATSALAGAATWQSSNIQYLYGSNFELGDSARSTLTFEHANGWKYGDNFFFVDVLNPVTDGNNTQTELYAEFSPRLSLSSLTGKKLSFPLVKDVLLAGTLEMGKTDFGGFRNYLYGVGFSLDLPKFAFADLNLLVRDNPKQEGLTAQATIDWMLPFNMSSAKLVFEGFADLAGAEGDTVLNLDIQPRLLLDLGNFWNTPGNLFAGMEYIYWHNKFGIDGVEENVAQAMVKVVF